MSENGANAIFYRLNGYAPTPTAGMVFDAISGGFRFVKSTDMAGGGAPVSIVGNVTGVQISSTTVSNDVKSGSNANSVLAANSSRNCWFIQNQGINPLYVRFSSNAASATNFNVGLSAGNATGDSLGGSWLDDVPRYRGAVSVSGIQPNFIIWEM